MNRLESLIRLSPKLSLWAALLDFFKQLLWLIPYWLHYHNQVLTTADYDFTDGRYTVDFIDRLLDLVLFPLGWVATAIIIHLLLELRDKRRAPHA